jgi:hypothetical protein
MPDRHRLLAPTLFLLATCAAAPAFAALVSFDLRHESGRCSERKFVTNKQPWSTLSSKRIDIATGEMISVHLYGHGADLATDAVGSGIFEWLGRKGRTSDSPQMGYVEVKIRADDSHGTGNRTVTVKWMTGEEKIPMRIVARCEDLDSFRMPGGYTGGSTSPVLTKPLTTCVPTPTTPCP